MKNHIKDSRVMPHSTLLIEPSSPLGMTNTTNRLENTDVIVTGAGAGIGEGCVRALLAAGAKVAGFDLSEAVISDDNYEHYIVDVRDEGMVQSTVKTVQSNFGRIDGLVNCAGIFSCSKHFYEMSLEEWHEVVSTNLTGTFICSKHVARSMIEKRKGKIVNISCIRSRLVSPGMADYAASKGAVGSLTAGMAADLAQYNVHVNAVAPGFTHTRMTEKSYSEPERRRKREEAVLLGRIANPSDVAGAVLFLLSESSNYITGETVFVDGGFKVFK
jgi:NAD(P)-dependent dehydrogenase (short-subunit alcohol dehydrogenase family)